MKLLPLLLNASKTSLCIKTNTNVNKFKMSKTVKINKEKSKEADEMYLLYIQIYVTS